MPETYSFEKARQLVLDSVEPKEGEMLPLKRCLFRYLAADLISGEPYPPFAMAAWDGYAVASADVESASADAPARLEIVEQASAGQPHPKKIARGQAMYAERGAFAPKGADLIVPLRYGERDGDFVIIRKAFPIGTGIEDEGAAVRPKNKVMTKGDLVTPERAALLAALGRNEAAVVRPPVFAVMSLGMELTPPDTDKMKAGQVRDSNSYMLSAKLADMHLSQMNLGIGNDGDRAVADLIGRVANQVDGLLLSGGRADTKNRFFEDTLSSRGSAVVDGVDIEPAETFSFGVLEGKPVFWLPGRPAEAILTYALFVRPAILKMMGARVQSLELHAGELSGGLSRECVFDTFIFAEQTSLNSGGKSVRLLSPQGLPSLVDAARADVAVWLRAGTHTLPHGANVDCIKLMP